MGKCIKCGVNFIGTAANPPGDGICHYCERTELKKQNAELKHVLETVLQKAPGYDWNVDPDSLTLLTGHALSSDCGKDYVRREELDADREDDWTASLIDRLNELVRENRALFEECTSGETASKLIQQVHGEFNAMRLKLDAAKAENARLREALLVIRNRINQHGWGTCGTYGISNAQLYDTDLTMINEALTKEKSHVH